MRLRETPRRATSYWVQLGHPFSNHYNKHTFAWRLPPSTSMINGAEEEASAAKCLISALIKNILWLWRLCTVALLGDEDLPPFI